ncbi:hypothetical protein LCGC14_2298940 [marine sediment metagenome]|uniref:Uncharacterized protein n=1 Tax=marine sediment metagenome TaxID=412755 RepID=A0A0F9DBK4_9ZZZZ
MPVHKKVAKAAKKVGITALKRVGVRLSKPIKKRIRKVLGKRLRRKPVASSISKGPRQVGTSGRVRAAKRLPGQIGIRRKVGLRDAGRPIKPKKQVGPPKVGFRTVKGRRGKRITIKRPRPRNA